MNSMDFNKLAFPPLCAVGSQCAQPGYEAKDWGCSDNGKMQEWSAERESWENVLSMTKKKNKFKKTVEFDELLHGFKTWTGPRGH